MGAHDRRVLRPQIVDGGTQVVGIGTTALDPILLFVLLVLLLVLLLTAIVVVLLVVLLVALLVLLLAAGIVGATVVPASPALVTLLLGGADLLLRRSRPARLLLVLVQRDLAGAELVEFPVVVRHLLQRRQGVLLVGLVSSAIAFFEFPVPVDLDLGVRVPRGDGVPDAAGRRLIGHRFDFGLEPVERVRRVVQRPRVVLVGGGGLVGRLDGGGDTSARRVGTPAGPRAFEAGERLPSTITDGRVVLCQFVRLGRPRPPVGGTARQYQPHEFGYGQRTTELSYGYSTLRHRPALSFKLSTKVWANFPESSQRSTRSFFARPGTTETLTA